jgi:hypothetical protein
MNQEIKQLSEQIMNSARAATSSSDPAREKLNELTGWLVGYVAGNQQIPAAQQLAILKKLRETQF